MKAQKTIKMKSTAKGAPHGHTVVEYEEGKVYTVPTDLADAFIASDVAKAHKKREDAVNADEAEAELAQMNAGEGSGNTDDEDDEEFDPTVEIIPEDVNDYHRAVIGKSMEDAALTVVSSLEPKA